MLSSICHYIKPNLISKTVSNPQYLAFIHHQQRYSQIKSQSRSQSTFNPHLEDVNVNVAPSSSPDTKLKETPLPKISNINTSLKTSLNDSLIPSYLHDTYWWAYTNPNAVKFWERQWLVDAILWGNFNTLKNEAIKEINHIESISSSQDQLNVTQIACVYGNFSTDLISELAQFDSSRNDDKTTAYNYKIVDIAPVQLINTKNKVDRFLNENKHNISISMHGQIDVDLYQNDSTNMMDINDNSEDITYLFFLLHEQPKDVRLKTIEETIRITKEGGKIIIVDYHKPISNINPFRYIMRPILTYLEPFAIDLWNEQVADYIEDINEKNKWNVSMDKELFFNGLYQKIVLTKSTN